MCHVYLASLSLCVCVYHLLLFVYIYAQEVALKQVLLDRIIVIDVSARVDSEQVVASLLHPVQTIRAWGQTHKACLCKKASRIDISETITPIMIFNLLNCRLKFIQYRIGVWKCLRSLLPDPSPSVG